VEAKFKSQLNSNKRFRRDIFGNIFSPDNNSATLKYHIDDRLSILLDLTNLTLHREPFIAVSALVNTTFFFNYAEYAPQYNPLIYLSVVLAIFLFVTLQILAVVKGIIFIRNQMDNARRRRRQGLSPKPMYSVQLLLHPKTKSLHNTDEDLVEKDTSFITDVKPLKNDRKLSCCRIMPVTLQPTADQKLGVYSIIVQGPTTNSNRYKLFAGIGIIRLLKKSEMRDQTRPEVQRTGKIVFQDITDEEMTTEL